MYPTTIDITPYAVMRGTCGVEILARCMCWDDAVVIANRHSASYIHNSENGTDYYRSERTVIKYMAKEVA